MGGVFKATDSLLGGRMVAVKIPLSAADGPRLKQEAKILGMVKNSHVMEVFDIKQEGELVYIVCELLLGQTVSQMLEKKKPNGLEEANIVEVAIDVLKALVATHATGIVHRDVKPSNVMCLESLHKLIDYGIAKNVSDQHNVAQTMAGVAPGTPLYMSPLAKDNILDIRSDIWAVVVSMLEMALCKVPPLLDRPNTPVPTSELRQKGYSEKFIAFIDKALQKEPDHGFQTAAEALKELQKLVHEKTGQTTMKNQIRQLLGGQGQIQEQLREQGKMAEVLIRLNRAELRLIEELVSDVPNGYLLSSIGVLILRLPSIRAGPRRDLLPSSHLDHAKAQGRGAQVVGLPGRAEHLALRHGARMLHLSTRYACGALWPLGQRLRDEDDKSMGQEMGPGDRHHVYCHTGKTRCLSRLSP
jgi:serine/threonine protein kinase